MDGQVVFDRIRDLLFHDAVCNLFDLRTGQPVVACQVFGREPDREVFIAGFFVGCEEVSERLSFQRQMVLIDQFLFFRTGKFQSGMVGYIQGTEILDGGYRNRYGQVSGEAAVALVVNGFQYPFTGCVIFDAFSTKSVKVTGGWAKGRDGHRISPPGATVSRHLAKCQMPGCCVYLEFSVIQRADQLFYGACCFVLCGHDFCVLIL